MISKIRNNISEFLKNNKDYPIIYAIAVGLYPIVFYYSNNYTLVNSLSHLAYFLLTFIGIPFVVFFLLNRIIPNKYRKKVLTFLSVFMFLFLLKVCLFGDIQKKISLGILIISLIAGYFLFKHLKKIVVIQLILALTGFFALSNTIIKQYSVSKEWMQQPDNIAEVEFVKKPNVYYIQPDGYVNFSELKKGYYNIKNNSFETFLKSNDFTYYNDFRSNYAFTLSSNSSSLMMKHHYYNNISNYKEVLNDRDIIISKNTVLDVFKNNGYKNYFITEMSYLLLNKPKMGFDYCNISYDNISYIGRGLDEMKDLETPLKKGIKDNVDKPKFFFIQILAPSHVSGSKMYSLGVEQEKQAWIKKLERSNSVLTKTISIIKENDPNALILIMADHGGYVGMEYTLESYQKMNDRDKIYSIFSSSLAIHWPNNMVPNYNTYLKSSVNVFRVIFSYLSENESYLSNLQSDFSFAIVNKGALPGVYKYIDENGEITFEKVSN
jgi:hypothetical protein